MAGTWTLGTATLPLTLRARAIKGSIALDKLPVTSWV